MTALWDKDSSWTFPLLKEVEKEIEEIAVGEYNLSVFPNQIEIITSEQMLDAYASYALPVLYNHWSFGKSFSSTAESYKRGNMGLAYEVVINSNPCISYLMEENTITMQTLVIAHAAYGHNSFFKNNYLFKQWIDPDFIIDYLLYAKKYINKCEETYGYDEVEDLLNCAHSLMDYGVDKYSRPTELSKAKKKKREQKRLDYIQQNLSDLDSTLPKSTKDEFKDVEDRFMDEPEENLLYFIEKHSPILHDWQREIIRIVRKISQYLYPQGLTKTTNEGYASFFHYTILNRLHEKGIITDGAMLEAIHSHTGVLYQPPWDSPHFTGMNPYALGFAIYEDIKRMCEKPDKEDEKLFPDIVGQDWRKIIQFAMENFKDESFIQQYLSPKVMKKLGLFTIWDYNKENYEIKHIHNEEGFDQIRRGLARQNSILFKIPEIEVVDYKEKEDRSLYLKHTKHFNIDLGGDIVAVMSNIVKLWGFKVKLNSYTADGKTKERTFTNS